MCTYIGAAAAAADDVDDVDDNNDVDKDDDDISKTNETLINYSKKNVTKGSRSTNKPKKASK